MHIDQLKKSRFLKREDCDPPITATIDRVEKQNVAPMGEKPEEKWCLFFNDGIKPLVLNSTNGQLIAKVLGSKDSDDWIGEEIELFYDPNVSFAGNPVGGIRVRKPDSVPF